MSSNKREITSELNLHRSVAEFMGWVVMLPAVWTTFPAGWSEMRKGAAGRLKGCGLKAGMPDILVFHNSMTIGIELKTRSTVSPEQQEMFNNLYQAGIPVSIARSVDDVERILRTYKIPLRKFSYAPRIETPESRRPQKPAQGSRRATA